jgi:hypothetical protein
MGSGSSPFGSSTLIGAKATPNAQIGDENVVKAGQSYLVAFVRFLQFGWAP